MSFPGPSITPPGLQNWQYQFNGLTFGAGTSYGVTNVQGLDLAPIRSGDAGRPLDQGELIGIDLLSGRDITFQMWVGADGENSLQTLLAQLSAATTVAGVTEQPLWVQLPNSPLLCAMVRPRKRTLTIDADYGAAGVATPAVMFHATDPRFYAPTQTGSVPLPTPVGGLSFPVSFPASFGAGSGAAVAAANSGNMEMRPQLVITGPVTNPWVQNASIAGTPRLTFSNPFQMGYTLNPGDTLTVDLDFQTITYLVSGTTIPSNVPFWLVPGSTWWNLPPGQTSTIQWGSSDSAATGGSLEVIWAPAYASAT